MIFVMTHYIFRVLLTGIESMLISLQSTTMATPNTRRIPVKISDYINDHFKEDFLFEVKNIKEGAHANYQIEVSKDNYIYTLQFDESGDLLSEEMSQAFQPDIHDDPGFEEIPD